MKKLSITFADNFLDVIVNTARERMFEELNPESAVDIIVKSFKGCSINDALNIIKGSYIMKFNDNNVTITEDPSEDNDNIIQINSKLLKIIETVYEDSNYAIEMFGGLSHIRKDGCITVDLDWKVISNFILGLDCNYKSSDIVIKGDNFEKVKVVVNELVRVRDRAVLTINLHKFIKDNYPEEEKKSSSYYSYYINILNSKITMINSILKNGKI